MKTLQKVWAAWKDITRFIGDFQARWLLTVFYFTLALPFGLLARMFDPLTIRRPPNDSAWGKREELEEINIVAAKRQF